jgi:hypothetical protein
MMFVASFELSQIKVFFHYTILTCGFYCNCFCFFFVARSKLSQVRVFFHYATLNYYSFFIVVVLLQDLNFYKLGFISIA